MENGDLASQTNLTGGKLHEQCGMDHIGRPDKFQRERKERHLSRFCLEIFEGNLS